MFYHSVIIPEPRGRPILALNIIHLACSWSYVFYKLSGCSQPVDSTQPMKLIGESVTVDSNAPLKEEWSQIGMLLAQEMNP